MGKHGAPLSPSPMQILSVDNYSAAFCMGSRTQLSFTLLTIQVKSYLTLNLKQIYETTVHF
jgi:hypothetical protein